MNNQNTNNATKHAKNTVAKAAKYFETVNKTKKLKKKAMAEMRNKQFQKNYSIGRVESALKHYDEMARVGSISNVNATMLKKNLREKVQKEKNEGYPAGYAELRAYIEHIDKGPSLDKLIMKHLHAGIGGGATRRNRKGTRRH
jgi:hypothetical protein